MRKINAFILCCALALPAMAQTKHNNKYPSAEALTYDNNGNDVKSYINARKSDLFLKGDVVNDASSNKWGYVQAKNVKVPSQNKEGIRNYYETLDANFMLFKSKADAKATWWTREYNLPRAPLVFLPADEAGLAIDIVKYSEILRELETKDMTVVECGSDMPNSYDYDVLLKNYFFVKHSAIKDASDYKTIVPFYNGFLSHFAPVNDPIIDNKSFITFFKTASTEYIGYFNVVNGKLAGKVETITAPFENDRIKLINDIFKKLTGSRVYVYADETFGFTKIITNKCQVLNKRVAFWPTTTTKKFNEEQ
jgi:hypothetical protein